MEVTRLYPAVPGGLPRVTPKGGAVIAGQFIPEGVSTMLKRTSYFWVLLSLRLIDCRWGTNMVNSPRPSFIRRALWIQAREVVGSRCRRAVKESPCLFSWSTYVCRQEVSHVWSVKKNYFWALILTLAAVVWLWWKWRWLWHTCTDVLRWHWLIRRRLCLWFNNLSWSQVSVLNFVGKLYLASCLPNLFLTYYSESLQLNVYLHSRDHWTQIWRRPKVSPCEGNNFTLHKLVIVYSSSHYLMAFIIILYTL